MGRRGRWRTLIVVTGAVLFVLPSFHAGAAQALQIGPIVFPDVNPPATIDQQKPTIVKKPAWAPDLSADSDVIILIPGTTDYDGTDQITRTRDIGLFGVPTSATPPITVVNYPAAFGIEPFGIPIYLAGSDTFSHSVEVGTRNGLVAATDPNNSDKRVVINGYSQSAPVAMNVAYLLHRSGAIPDDKVVVIIGADSRFPHSGVENVVPSFLPGMYTNGDRDPAATGDIAVYSYCVRGDSTCGVGNPLINPVSTFFYLVPGFYIHSFLNNRINEYAIEKEWTDGNTHYVVYNGGNPWVMVLRDLGVPVPDEVGDALSALVPVPMPGQQSTLADIGLPMPTHMRDALAKYPVPTPRELQVIINNALGLDTPVHDPDTCAATPSACRVDYSDLLSEQPRADTEGARATPVTTTPVPAQPSETPTAPATPAVSTPGATTPAATTPAPAADTLPSPSTSRVDAPPPTSGSSATPAAESTAGTEPTTPQRRETQTTVSSLSDQDDRVQSAR